MEKKINKINKFEKNNPINSSWKRCQNAIDHHHITNEIIWEPFAFEKTPIEMVKAPYVPTIDY